MPDVCKYFFFLYGMLKPKYVSMFDNNIIQIKKVDIFVKFKKKKSQKKL